MAKFILRRRLGAAPCTGILFGAGLFDWHRSGECGVDFARFTKVDSSGVSASGAVRGVARKVDETRPGEKGKETGDEVIVFVQLKFNLY